MHVEPRDLDEFHWNYTNFTRIIMCVRAPARVVTIGSPVVVANRSWQKKMLKNTHKVSATADIRLSYITFNLKFE